MNGRRYSSWMLERLAIGDTVRLCFGNTSLGRHSSSNIRILEASFVSRHHAIIKVSNNDENVSLLDVSSNGIYVNERRYDKENIQLKNNDLIGFGVSPTDLEDDADILKLPIYKLKYAPIRKLQIPNSTKSPPVAVSQPESKSDETTRTDNKMETDSNVDGAVQKPCSSKNIKVEKLIRSDEIFEISDDDDDCDALKTSKLNEKGIVIQQKQIETNITSHDDNHQKLAIDLNKQIEFVIKSESFDDNECINPSQRNREKKSDDEILNLKEDNDDNFVTNPSQKSLDHKPNTKDVKNLKEKEENVNQPTMSMESIHNNEAKESLMHVPIISNIKKEQLRCVTADIQNIFGDIEDDDEMQKTIKEINPLVYNEMNALKNFKPLNGEEKLLNHGDLIVLTDDEDLGEVEEEELGTIISNIVETEKELELKNKDYNTQVTTETKGRDNDILENQKSPSVFDCSYDNSKEEVTTIDINQYNKAQKVSDNTDNIDLDDYTKYIPNSDDEDIEDLMFSQVLINDMKAELQDDLHVQENLPIPNTNIGNQVPSGAKNDDNAIIIKKEPSSEVYSSIPKELENSCWIISDDEYYDEELETKVNDWSTKIFSQSVNTYSQNMSQVYEMEETSNDEDDYFEEDDINLLEDDIEGIANMYNSIEDQDVDKNVKSLNDELKYTEEKEITELNNTASKEFIPKEPTSNENNMRQEMLESMEVDQVENVQINRSQVNPAEISSPVKNNDCSEHIESPIIRTRRLSKTKPVIQSSSSSEDELDIRNRNISNCLAGPEADKLATKQPPQVIEAPALPKHRGKLRGVSAELPKKTIPNLEATSVDKTINSIKQKIHDEYYTKNLKRKWLEKPSIAKKRDKEQKKSIKECRKDKLKELVERKKHLSKENGKRKMFTEAHKQKSKVAKVKVTTHNRGAFLADNNLTPPLPSPATHGQKAEQVNHFKIPKAVKKTDEDKKPNGVDHNEKIPPPRSLSVDCFDTFSQQISKPDTLLFKRENSETKKCDKSKANPLRRHSITEALKRPRSIAICKESIAARAVRTTNKITFASMERNIVENEENKRKLNALSATPLFPLNKDTSTTIPSVKKFKKVRFNDTPVIHYIERVTGASKKIINKDVLPMTTYKDRRNSFNTTYSVIDHTDTIISKILCWSNEWLTKRNAAADAASDVIYPMPAYFNSFEHYKSIIFPLMKLEFVSTLERDYNITKNVKKFKVSLEYATQNQDRIMLITKYLNIPNRELMDSITYDLVILESDKRGPQIFAFVVANRKGAGSFVTIVYQIIAKNFTLEYFKAIREFCVRPVMDRVRVHFGAFNSVYQLQSTPLFQKIINPLELLKCRPSPKKKVIYRGFDKLNDKQRQVLLNTYVKIIDESTPNITLIQGPPGTGKSCVIANLVLQSLYGEEVRYLDKKILLCAQSNAAIDVIAHKLYDISMRMRPEKRFRLIRYGVLNKMHPSVLPIALQKVVEHDQLKKLQAKNGNIQLENKENLKNQILQVEAQVVEMSSRNIKGTIEEDILIEKKRQLQLMRNILYGNVSPEDERSLFTWYLCNANIVCATLSSCVNLSQYINFFDICVIDEATQCTEPWTLLPLKFGINSLVLVGDTQQLPATVLSKKASELGLGTSMFTRIQNCLDSIPCTSIQGSKANVTTPNSITYSLQTQYRMHPEICRWPNQYFYRNELINDKSTIDFNKSPLVPFSILSLAYTQNNSGVNGKITNDLEAEFVAKLLKALDGLIPNKYNSYGVITPYAHQRATLESSIRKLGLTNIMVNTIDSYQGLEKQVIVISNARTNGIGFLSNPQRLNVALTRAKKCLILCGNFKNLEPVPVWRCLLENARHRKLYHEINETCIEDIQRNVIEKIRLKNQNQ